MLTGGYRASHWIQYTSCPVCVPVVNNIPKNIRILDFKTHKLFGPNYITLPSAQCKRFAFVAWGKIGCKCKIFESVLQCPHQTFVNIQLT